MPCEIRKGTSGWHYQHWLGKFYPNDLRPPQMLAYYVRRFDSVELNNSFYRLPQPEAFIVWRLKAVLGSAKTELHKTRAA